MDNEFVSRSAPWQKLYCQVKSQEEQIGRHKQAMQRILTGLSRRDTQIRDNIC